MVAIFFSHASVDDAVAETNPAVLVREGFSGIFADHDNIRGGDKWSCHRS
jgi:hypothetical protein